MVQWFLFCLAGFVLILVPYFLSLEHSRLDQWFGDRGTQIGGILGILSGWGFFGFWIGLWVSPQTRFQIGYPLFEISSKIVSTGNLGLSLILLTPGVYLGVKGVLDLGLRVSETHRPDKLVTGGLYGVVRHPQYLGGLFGHFGVSILLGSRDALLISPLVVLVVYLLCWKEEKELLRQFGRGYRKYQENVPMFIPRR